MARYIQSEALKYDILAQAHLERYPADADNMAQKIGMFNKHHPWLGLEVDMYGIPLTVSIDSDEAVPYCLPTDRRREVVRGKYSGLALRQMYDPETDEHLNKIVYAINTFSEGPVLTPFGAQVFTQHFTYLCLQGNEAAPLLPYQAHSLEDLANDPVIAEADEIILGDEDDKLLQIAQLGERVNELLADEDIEFEAIDLNHQRASYINSLGLHHVVKLETNDAMVVPSDELDDSCLFTELTSEISFAPQFFTIGPGYDRITGEDIPLRGGPPELYARLEIEDDQVLLAPLKSIQNVEDLK